MEDEGHGFINATGRSPQQSGQAASKRKGAWHMCFPGAGAVLHGIYGHSSDFGFRGPASDWIYI
jgi:hypothetical protein